MKITITIDSSDLTGKKEIIINPFDLIGKYVISRSNFTDFTERGNRAYIKGVPLKVTTSVFKMYGEYYFRAVSMITGIQYLIHYSPKWMDFYDTYAEVVANSLGFIRKGYKIYDDGQLHLEQIVLKDYYPMDNTWAVDMDGYRFPVKDHKCLILSTPYKGDTWNKGEDLSKYWFVMVRKEDGSVGRCLFQEDFL